MRGVAQRPLVLAQTRDFAGGRGGAQGETLA